MGSPGGKEVGRVSVRVVPNTSGFKKKLESELKGLKLELKVPVTFDIDTAKLRAQLAAMKLGAIKIPVNFDVDRLGKSVTAQSVKPVKVPVVVDRAALKRDLAAIDLRAKVNIDQANFERALRDTQAGFRKFDKLKITLEADQSPLRRALVLLKDDFNNLGAVGTSVLSGIGSAVTGLGSAFVTLGSSLTGAVALLVLLPAVGTAIAAAGAAIAAAWGAASTAIAAVPAAIGLIGAPLAVVMLGMDGIKKAAQTLKPEFDKLKTSVSNTFQQGLTPVFNQLKGSLAAITPQINLVANAIVGLAGRTADYLTKAGGITRVQELFTNVAAAIDKINLTPLLDGLLRLAGNQAALQALVGTINEVGAALSSIAANPSLDAAFAGLEKVLVSLTRAFTGLVNNGIKLFAAAAPGISSSLDSITQFFSGFDYQRLGTAVGNAFRGIGDAIKSIPPGTVESITKSFEGLGQAFQSDTFKTGLQGFTQLIPPAIDALTLLVKAFGAVGTAIIGWQAIFKQAAVWIGEFTDSIGLTEGAAGRAQKKLDDFIRSTQGPAGPPPSVEEIKKSVQSLPPILGGAATATKNSLSQIPIVTNEELSKVGPLFGQLLGTTPQLAAAAVDPAVTAVGGALAGMSQVVAGTVGPVPQTVGNLLNPMAGVAGQAAAGVPAAVQTPLQQLQGIIGTAVGPVPTTLQGLLGQMPPIAGQEATKMVGLFGSGLGQLTPELQRQLGLLPPVAETGFGDVSAAVQPGLAQVGPEVTAGLDPAQAALASSLSGLATGVPAALAPVSTAISTGLATSAQGLPATFGPALQTGLTTAFGTVFAAMPTIFTTPFQTALATATTALTAGLPTIFTTPFQTGLTTAFTTVFAAMPTIFTTPFQTALTTAVTTITAQMPTIFGLPFQTALTTAFAAVFTAFPTIFTLPFQTAMTTAFTAIFAAFPTIFTLPFQTALTTALTALFAQFPTIFTLPFQTALTTAFTTIFATFPTIFTLPFQTALTTAITAVAALIPTLFVPLQTAFTTAFTAIVASIKTGFETPAVAAVTAAMTAMTTAVTAGATKVKAAITAMNTAVIAELNKLPPAGTATGNNLIKAICDAIIAGRSAVVNAIAQVIAAAIAQAQSQLQIASPSKVFYNIFKQVPAGAVKAVLDGKNDVVNSIKTMTDSAIRAGQGVGDSVFDAMGFDGASLTNKVSATAGMPAAPTSIGGDTFNIYAADGAGGKKIADDVVFAMRTGRRKGVHSGR